ncbi:MAG: thymidylate kinase [Methanobacteriales archaeon HGW-Methanobacteriales-1]|jgi:dTMP kinase|nr:MAG: thymidylate kinase [Methanobacteriales archaeon HGW-Methanobacteriales-1]
MRFIVIDGLDGAGKDTHSRLIVEKYVSKGENVVFRSHPESDNKYGLKAKKALLGQGKKNKIKAAFYYAADVIRSLRLYYGKSDTLIFSRYLMGVTYLPLNVAKIFYFVLEAILPTSRYMFFLDVTPEESLRRISTRKETEMFENLEDLKKVRFKALKFTKGWYVVNSCGTIENVQKQIDIILDDLDQINK